MKKSFRARAKTAAIVVTGALFPAVICYSFLGEVRSMSSAIGAVGAYEEQYAAAPENATPADNGSYAQSAPAQPHLVNHNG